MNLFYTLLHLEEDDSIHLGRLLILLAIFTGQKGTGSIGGLTNTNSLNKNTLYGGDKIVKSGNRLKHLLRDAL